MSRDIADDMAVAMSPWLRTMSRDVAGDMFSTTSPQLRIHVAPCRWRHVMPLSAMSRNVHFWRWRHRWRCADMSLAMSQLVILSFGDVAGHVAGDIARRANEAAPCRAIVLNIAPRHRRRRVSHRQHRQLVPTVAFFIKSNTKKSLSVGNARKATPTHSGGSARDTKHCNIFHA